MHEVSSGHQATCKQNYGTEYGGLETCFKNQQFSNEKVHFAFKNGQVIWRNTLIWTRAN
jgi:hypothetical protein